MAWTQVKRKDLAGFEGQQSVSLPVKQPLEQGPAVGVANLLLNKNPRLIPRQVVPWATFWLMGGFTGQTCVSCGHRKIHFSILKCFGKLFKVTVPSFQAKWKDLKKEEEVPLWGRETPGSPVLMGSRASHPRERSPCLNSTRLDYGNFCGQCLHASQLTHSHADLPLLFWLWICEMTISGVRTWSSALGSCPYIITKPAPWVVTSVFLKLGSD